MDIGIDLGTTFSVLVVNGRVTLRPDYPPGEYIESMDITLIPTPYGERTFPSAMAYDGLQDQLCFGSDALTSAEEGQTPVLFFKRKMGTDERLPIKDRHVTAREASTEFLKYLKDCAEKALGQKVYRAVITHPAYFDPNQVEETRQAAVDAGFDMSMPEQLLMEPIAAALCYTRSDQRDPLGILTYDLGGGTFDTTFLERREGVIHVQAFGGDHLLGGYNFDRELLHWLLEALKKKGHDINLSLDNPNDRGVLTGLLRLCETVKCRLSEQDDPEKSVEIRERGLLRNAQGAPVQIQERITLKQFKELIADHLKKTVECCLKTIDEAGVTADEVHEILLVGGSSKGSWVSQAISEAFPGVEPKLFEPDLAVGIGAALYARMTLPAMVHLQEYDIHFSAPETTPLDVIELNGRIESMSQDASLDGLSVHLRLADSSETESIAIDAQGGFMLPEIELDPGDNTFTIVLADTHGSVLAEHDFTICQKNEGHDVSSVQAVLPKPLMIETVDGLIPLVERGVSLPSQCVRRFVRTDNSPTVTLRLFQMNEPIGEVLISSIPAEAGRGSEVLLDIEVTSSNEIRGKAVISSKNHHASVTAPISTRFQTPEIQHVDDLVNELESLKEAIHKQSDASDEEVQKRVYLAREFVKKAETLLSHQWVERQEVQEIVSQIQRLIRPGEDKMVPSRDVFETTLNRVRRSLANLECIAREKLEHPETIEETLKEVTLQQASNDIKAVAQFQPMLDQIVAQMEPVYQQRQRSVWAKLYDSLTDIEAFLRKKTEKQTPDEIPPFILQLILMHELSGLREILHQKIQKLIQQQQIQSSKDAIGEIESLLKDAENRIDQFNSNTSQTQARALQRQITNKCLKPAKSQLDKLGLTQIRRV